MGSETQFSHLDHIASPVFVLQVSDEGLPIYAAFNAHARRVAQRPLSDFLGKTAVEIYGEALGRVAYRRHCEVIDSGKTTTYELELPIGDGPRQVRTTLSPVFDDAGNVVMIYGSSVDLSADKRARETQVSLDTLTNEMEQFIAMAAHDLRAPMRNVGQIADMLREDFVDHGDGKVELIDMLEDIAGKSMSLISDVLAHARATEKQRPMELFDLAPLCRDIFDILDPSGKHRLVVDPVTLRTEKTALQITLRNLIENALKHGQRAQMDIEVVARAFNADQIELCITDNGVGFDNPGVLFLESGEFRVDSGYGMLGIRRLINARNGVIHASNRETGNGSVVSFTLPGQWYGDPTHGPDAGIARPLADSAISSPGHSL